MKTKEKLLEEFNNKVKLCEECDPFGLNKKLISGILLGSGNINSQIMFVGQNPSIVRYSVNDQIFGNPGVSNTDKVFCEGLRSIGFDRKDVYCTNLIKGSLPGNRRPFVNEIVHGMSHLVDEIEIIRPKIVVCVGNIVCESFNIKVGEISKKNYVYFGMNHPTSVVRGSIDMEEYLSQWQKLKEIIKKENRIKTLKGWTR